MYTYEYGMYFTKTLIKSIKISFKYLFALQKKAY